MDFLTAMAYWGILLLIIVNAILVSRMEITIHDDESQESEATVFEKELS
jgi:hypothetical protein